MSRVAAGRQKSRPAADWSGRLGGIVLCAFFALGVVAGIGVTGRHGGLALVRRLRHASRQLAPFAGGGGAIATVERSDGLYLLAGDGSLSGPISARAAGDLPVLSGSGLDYARASQLLEYASLLVRAEALWSELVSEMKVENDGTATLFLEQTHTAVTVDVDRGSLELTRAAAILTRWRARQDLVAAMDLTVSGQAVLRLRQPLPVALQALHNQASFRRPNNGEMASR
ncbi:MAG TPA: hypothetical protein VKV28_11565 [Candidatus Binataceae bacterium]|nr:hypothetical protein [Candidatus Binataceae bacterium]